MICRSNLVKRRLDTHEIWKYFSNKTCVGNVMNSRHSVLTEIGQLERWLISKLLLEGLALREIIVSETSQILQIYLLFKNRNAEKRLHAFARIEGSWKKTIITGNCNVPFNTVLKFAYLKVHTVLAIIGIFCGPVTLLFVSLVSRQKVNWSR